MTANIGLYFVISILAMIPLVFLGAGQDTTRQRAVRKQCRKDVLLDWTDKDALAAEHQNARKACDVPGSACLARDALTFPRPRITPTATAAVEVISREASGLYAA